MASSKRDYESVFVKRDKKRAPRRTPLEQAMAKLASGTNEKLTPVEMAALLQAHPWNDHLWWQTHPNLIPF